MWMRLRAELRGKLRSMLLLVLAVGLAGVVTLTALAGARRTNSAVSRFLAYERPPDGSVDPVDPGHDDLNLLAKVARLAQVTATDEIAYVFLAQPDASGQPFHSGMSTFAFVDRADLSRPRVLAGRMPAPDRADEIAVNPSAAATGHLAVGSTLRFRGFQPDQALQILRDSDVSPTGPLITVGVVGIALRPTDLSLSEAAPGTLFASQDAGYLTPGFFRSFGSQVARVRIGMDSG